MTTKTLNNYLQVNGWKIESLANTNVSVIKKGDKSVIVPTSEIKRLLSDD